MSCQADFLTLYPIFTRISAGPRIQGTLYGFDIEPELIAECNKRARQANVQNAKLSLRDFLAEGSGLDKGSVDYVMLFNILHVEHPLRLLSEARRILSPDGLVAVIHWNYDPSTPRGPSMAIRPRPLDCLTWIKNAGFEVMGGIVNLPPYHYGIIGHLG